MEKENYDLSSLQFISSFADKDPTKFIKIFLEHLNEKELQQFKLLTEDSELMTDLSQLAVFHKENFSSVYPKDYIEKLDSFNNNPEPIQPPELKNGRKVALFFNFIKKLAEKESIPRQKIFQKSKIAEEFDIDLVTLNNWLAFFGIPYPKQREFTSLEYKEIVKKFTTIEGVSCQKFKKYFYVCYNKSIISEIIGDPEKSPQTNYRHLLKNRIDAEGWDDNDEEFLQWVDSHHKMPFSLAYRLISLIIKYNSKMKDKDIETVFEEYWNNIP